MYKKKKKLQWTVSIVSLLFVLILSFFLFCAQVQAIYSYFLFGAKMRSGLNFTFPLLFASLQ